MFSASDPQSAPPKCLPMHLLTAVCRFVRFSSTLFPSSLHPALHAADHPMQVVRCALENAASVARTFLMSDVVVRTPGTKLAQSCSETFHPSDHTGTPGLSAPAGS